MALQTNRIREFARWPQLLLVACALCLLGALLQCSLPSSDGPQQGEPTAATGEAISNPCTSVSVATNPSGSTSAGTHVLVTPTGVCPGGTAQYQFWLRTPGSPATWAMVQDYGVGSTWNWDTTSSPAGVYDIMVYVRTVGDTAAWEAYTIVAYTLTEGNPCTGVTVSTSPSSPVTVGTAVTVSGVGTCPSGAPQYEFWLYSSSGGWTIQQAYSSTASWTWNTTGFAGGNYEIMVYVRTQGDTNSEEAYTIIPFTLNTSSSCTSVSLTASPAGSAGVGTPVTLTAAGTCPSGETPNYEFFSKAPGGQWTQVQAYGSSANYAWNTTGLATGTYYFMVYLRAQGNSDTWEAYTTISYSLTGGVSLSGYASAYATAFCQRMATCCGGNTGTFNMAACVANNEVYGWEYSLPGSLAEYDAGHIQLNQSAANACISALSNAACPTETPAQYANITSTCYQALQGTIPIGSGPCSSSFECVPGAYCRNVTATKDGGTEGGADGGADAGPSTVCAAVVGSGQPCDQGIRDEACSYLGEVNPAYYCDRIDNPDGGATCQPRRADGQSCTKDMVYYDDQACSSLLCGDNWQCGSNVTIPSASFCSYYSLDAGGGG